MTTRTLSALGVGLSSLLGLAWSAARVAADGPPALTPTPGVAAPAPAVPAAPGPEAPVSAVLLLSTGEVVKGLVEETDEGYLVRTPIGELPYRRRQVERIFGSLAEVYAYKRGRTPQSDPDERLKLAQWCLAQKLNPEAQVELRAVLALNPEDGRARSMLFQLQSAAQRGMPTDAGVQRTAGERVEPPAALSSTTLKELREAGRNNPLASSLPVIFDLPQAQAVKRYQEFGAYVHRELQRTCAQCHNEQASSKFQLIQARSKRDLENDLLVRANLDATLRLIDPKDPSKSPLLSAAILPHPPSGKPILTGPNHPTYRVLITWVQGLHSPGATAARPAAAPAAAPTASGVVPAGAEVVTPAPGQFAADRLAAPRAAAPPAGATAPAPTTARLMAEPPAPLEVPHSIQFPGGEARQAAPVAAGQMLPGSTTGLPTNPPPPAAFAPPTLPRPTSATATAAAPTAAPEVAKPGAPKTITVPGLGEVPVVDTREIDAAPKATEPGEAARKKKALDASALQKFMSGRKR
jgi:hypothetical protein